MRGASGVARGANRTQMSPDGAPVDGWMVMKDDGTPVEGEMTATDEQVKEATERAEKAEGELEAAQARVTELEAAAAAAPPAPAEGVDTSDPVAVALADTSLPEPIRKAFEAQQADLKAARERAEKADNDAKVERDMRIDASFVAKAAELDHLPTEADTLGPVLRAAADALTTEQFDELERVLRAANEQLESSALFAELGSGGPSATSTSAFAEIEREAETIRKADTSLTKEQAIDKASQMRPDLVAKHRAEQRG